MGKEWVMTRGGQKERAVILAVKKKVLEEEYDFEESVKELKALILAAGACPAETFTQKLAYPHSRTYLGKGKLEDLLEWLKEQEIPIDFCVVDDELSPTQHKNLTRILGMRVIDRTHLILDIFSRRAHTHLGKLQVELAQLRYLAPRLIGMWSHFEKQEGAIGTRGPGETQLETDKRLLKKRILFLEEQLEKSNRQNTEQRKQRVLRFAPLFALVGYTNAGKTSLLNLLSRENLVEQNALFTTLDTVSRKVWLDGKKEIIVSDTVGFIQRIPHTLVQSFRTTLEEVRQADCLIHVIDVSDPKRDQKMETVMQTLREIIPQPSSIPVIYVFNKSDLWENQENRFGLASFHSPAIFVSCKTGEGKAELLASLESMLQKSMKKYTFRFSHLDGRQMNNLFLKGIVHENLFTEEGNEVVAHTDPSLTLQLKDYIILEHGE